MNFINDLIFRCKTREVLISGGSLWIAFLLIGNGSAWAQEFPDSGIGFSIPEESIDSQEKFLAEEQERLDLKRRNLELQEELIDLQKRINEAREAQIGLDDNISSPLELPPGTTSGTTVGPAVNGTPLQSKIRTIDASRRAVKLITEDIKDIPDISSLVIYNQADFGKLKFYLLYETLRSSLVDSYQVEFEALNPTSDPEAPNRTRAFPLAAGAATVVSSSKTVLRSLVEILSFFRSQDTITFNDYNPGGSDGNVDFLVAQLVSNLNKSGREDVRVYSPSLYWVDLEDNSSRFGNQDNTLKKLLGNIDELRQQRKEAEKILASYGIDPGYPEEFLPSSRLGERLGKLLSLNEKSIELENFLDGVTDEITAPPIEAEESPLLGEAEEVEKNPLFLLELLEGAQIHEVLRDDGSYALILDVLASGGSQRIRQSLFTTIFTGSRLSYNGGIAIQYFLLNKDNSIKTADVVYYNTGFKGAGKIRKPKK